MNRLLGAVSAMVNVGLGIAAGFAFVKATGALQRPLGAGLPPQLAARIQLANHDVLVIAELLGGLIGLIAAQAVQDITPRGRLISLLLLPLPMIGGLAVGLELATYHVLLLVALGLALTASIYLLRLGLRGGTVGGMLFLGGVLGDRLAGAVAIGQIYWLAAEVAIAVLAAILVKVVIFHGDVATTLARTQRTFDARTRQAIDTVSELLERPDPRAREHVHRQLLRLNEAALIIDATLPRTNLAGSSVRTLRESMFELELAVGDMARSAEELGHLALAPSQRALAREALTDIHSGQLDRAARTADALSTHLATDTSPAGGPSSPGTLAAARLASAIGDYVAADRLWRLPAPPAQAAESLDADPFTPAAGLIGGWLPGTILISAQASRAGHPGGRWGTVRLAPTTRAAVQMAVAAGLSLFIGNVVSSQRFYWAILATWLVFLGTSYMGEQVTKAFNRTVGTLLGVFAGGLVAHVIGYDDTLALTVVLLAIFLGMYLQRISYAFLIFGITVGLAQLYQQLHEFSNHLLLLRVEETAIGAGVTAAVVLVVLPLSNRQVLRAALGNYVQALARVLDDTVQHLSGEPGEAAPDPAADVAPADEMALVRAADAAYNALELITRPVARRRVGANARRAQRLSHALAESFYHARTLRRYARKAGRVDDQRSREGIRRAYGVLSGSLAEIPARLDGETAARYRTSGPAWTALEQELQVPGEPPPAPALAMHQLGLIDGAMAEVASILDMSTQPAGSGSPPAVPAPSRRPSR